MTRRISTACMVLLVLLPAIAAAEVTRVDVLKREDVLGGRAFGSTGPYQHIVGRVYFEVDPNHPRNRVVADLDKAPRNAAGRVELSADLEILAPRDPALGNGIALVEVVNRGRKRVLASFNRGVLTGDVTTEEHLGDGLLLRRGYTIVLVGWEFDLPKAPGLLRVEVPRAQGVTGMATASFVPNGRSPQTVVGDLAGYAPSDPASMKNVLSWIDERSGARVTVPRNGWRLEGNTVTLGEAVFEPGRTYELSYAAADPPVSGLGLVAIRDTASWIKYTAGAVVSAKHAIAFGSSQSGRFLRDYLYLGFNGDERERTVFDGVFAHIAGAGRLLLNQRWAKPTGQGMYEPTTVFPFATTGERDPVTGGDEGLLDNPRARNHRPRVFFTNSSVEYWGGGRVAALVHTSPDGARDLTLPDGVRVYFLTGTQHAPAAFPPSAENGQQKENPTEHVWAMRALLVSMERWIREGVAPPPSSYPRVQDKTLVRADHVGFPSIAHVGSPRALTAGTRAANPLVPRDGAPGTPLPFLVPQVDKDGNETSGIRMPEVAVPLATYTGWNFRAPALGAPDRLYPLLGSYIPFAATKAGRERSGDSRPSIEERYSSRAQYLERVRGAGEALVRQGYLLADDLPAVVKRAETHWDQLAGR